MLALSDHNTAFCFDLKWFDLGSLAQAGVIQQSNQAAVMSELVSEMLMAGL